ncbi:hypothetical protein MPSEU_000416400 [Mayamaea pseudoterrestris]|nr:hypothetical protein MPSEU_000416400 [Mayamaea pseudoterrestris]
MLKGRLIPDPSSHMKAIYEREKLISSSASNSVGSVGTLASDNKVSTLATMDKNACNEDSRTHVVLETPEPPQSYDPENVPSSGVQHARALFENLILRSPTKPIASHSPMKATVVKHTDKLPHFNSSSETHNSAKAHEAECQSMPTESVPINAANAETMPGVECTFKKEALLSPEGQSSLIHVIETACNNLVKEKEDLVEPPDCFTTDEPSLTTIPSAPDAGVKPVGSPMLLSEARRARMSMEKAANRPHKSALLPLVSARRLSGSVHDLEIANLVVPTLSSAEKLPTVDAAVEEVGNINASHVENKCLQQPISLPTTPVRIERKSIGEMARERRANKHSSTSAAILPEPAVEECTDDSKAMIPGHEMELLNAGSHDAAATPPKGHLLELAYLKRENRRVSLGTEDAS